MNKAQTINTEHSAVAIKKRISDVVAEYEIKRDGMEEAVAAFELAGNNLRAAASVQGTFADSIDTGHVYGDRLKSTLRKSAWRYMYQALDIAKIASAKDKNLFEQHIENAPEFTLDSIRQTFGDYLLDPRGNILRSLAEAFCALDDSYKSHDKVKIGVKGLPKRVILSNVKTWGGWGRDYLTNILNALAQYQGKPLVTHAEIEALLKDEDALLTSWEATDYKGKAASYPARGVRLRTFGNGNGHLFFEPDTLLDINRALAEYYGDVLPDCSEGMEEAKRKQSTAVAKDLQYYPTPIEVVKRAIDRVWIKPEMVVLEPSCGDGRIMDVVRDMGAVVHGVEVDAGRAAQCRKKGHRVLTANFLEVAPNPVYDFVVMNPPFYGKHYAKHVEHAMRFLKDGGTLIAILPVTARYDHGLLDGQWSDLPVGSFRESGTNINTTVLTKYK